MGETTMYATLNQSSTNRKEQINIFGVVDAKGFTFHQRGGFNPQGVVYSSVRS